MVCGLICDESCNGWCDYVLGIRGFFQYWLWCVVDNTQSSVFSAILKLLGVVDVCREYCDVYWCVMMCAW